MLGPSSANQRNNRAPSQFTAMGIRIVATVSLDHGGFSQGPTPLASDRWNRLHQSQKLGHIVPVRLRDKDRKGNPLSFSDEMVFCPLFPAIRGIRPRFRPPTQPSPKSCRPPHERNRSCPPLEAVSEVPRGSSAKLPVSARHADIASNSSPNRGPALAGTSPRESHCVIHTRSP